MKASHYHPITLHLSKENWGLTHTHTHTHTHTQMGSTSPVAQQGKNLPANAGDLGDTGSVPESGRCPGKGSGTPLQYSRLGNLMDIGARRATVHGVTNKINPNQSHSYLFKLRTKEKKKLVLYRFFFNIYIFSIWSLSLISIVPATI